MLLPRMCLSPQELPRHASRRYALPLLPPLPQVSARTAAAGVLEGRREPEKDAEQLAEASKDCRDREEVLPRH